MREQLIITKGNWGWGEGEGRSLKSYNRRNLEDDSEGSKMNECHRSQVSKSLQSGASGFKCSDMVVVAEIVRTISEEVRGRSQNLE